MHYEGMIIRPPSEADSILLQVTVGCSHNKCTFCGTYKGERFKIKSDERIWKDIAYAAKHYTFAKRLFLCDGDALIIPQKRLVSILDEINRQLPWLDRISVYANAKGIRMKSVEELTQLRERKLKLAYMGLESGDNETLKHIRKGASSEQMIAMGNKIRSAGIKLSITVLLGVAGKERSAVHAEETGKVLSAINPEFVGALSLMLIPGTELHDEYKEGRFDMPESKGMLEELRTMIANTEINGLFHANHASNYLPIRAKLPEDKEKTLNLIDEALSGRIRLKPEFMRAL